MDLIKKDNAQLALAKRIIDLNTEKTSSFSNDEALARGLQLLSKMVQKDMLSPQMRRYLLSALISLYLSSKVEGEVLKALNKQLG